MDEKLPDEKPARAWLWYFIAMVALIGVALVMLGTGTAKAQPQPQIRCGPIRAVVDLLAVSQERVMWSGVVEQGTAEILLFQSPRETWSLVTVQKGIGCIVEKGNAGTPIEQGKGV